MSDTTTSDTTTEVMGSAEGATSSHGQAGTLRLSLTVEAEHDARTHCSRVVPGRRSVSGQRVDALLTVQRPPG